MARYHEFRPKNKRRTILNVEMLEDRTVPAASAVTLYNDGSLVVKADLDAGVQEAPVPLNFNSVAQGNFQVLDIYHKVQGTNSLTLDAIDTISNSMVQLAYQNADGTSSGFGTTIGGNAALQTAGAYHYVLTITQANVTVDASDNVIVTLQANIGTQGTETITHTYNVPKVGQTTMDLTLKVYPSVVSSGSSQLPLDALPGLTLSTMYDGPTAYNANVLAYTDPNGDIQDQLPSTWTDAASMSTARSEQTATLLGNGVVLIAGGAGPNGVTLSSAELYDPANNTWSPAGSMAEARYADTATLLNNGMVLVTGGLGSNDTQLSSAELYDPVSNTWSSAGNMASTRDDQTATLLGDGMVLVTGGLDDTGHALATAELYDPVTNTWSDAAPLAQARYGQTATLLNNGMVLVAGGYGDGGLLSSAELYNPLSNTWSSAGPMLEARVQPTATLLENGMVLVAGGGGYQGSLSTGLSSAELYDPVSNTWSSAASMASTRLGATSALLSNGMVLVAGGVGGVDDAQFFSNAELYNPNNNTWTPAGSMDAPRELGTATLLGNGQVLIAGGADANNDPSASADLYNPGSNGQNLFAQPQPIGGTLTLQNDTGSTWNPGVPSITLSDLEASNSQFGSGIVPNLAESVPLSLEGNLSSSTDPTQSNLTVWPLTSMSLSYSAANGAGNELGVSCTVTATPPTVITSQFPGTVSTSNPTPVYGTPVTLTATVSPSIGGTTPSQGSVEFYLNGTTPLGAGTFAGTDANNDEIYTYVTGPNQLQVILNLVVEPLVIVAGQNPPPLPPPYRSQSVTASYTAGPGFANSSSTNTVTETVTPAPLTITAAPNTKTYDGTTSAAAIPTIVGLQGTDTVTGLKEAYDDPSAGTGKTLNVLPGYVINDGNEGEDYRVSTVQNTSGVIILPPPQVTTAPSPIAPTGNVAFYIPIFDWTAVDGADHYDLWIDDVTTNSLDYRDQNISGTWFQPGPGFSQAGHQYRWWVRAIDAYGNPGPWSAESDYTFSEQGSLPDNPNTPPADLGPPPTPISPVAGESPTWLYSWSAVSGAHFYDLWIDDLTANVSPLYRAGNVSGTSFEPGPSWLPIAGHQYEWWVRAVDAAGFAGDWSVAVEFTDYSLPAPTSPADMDTNTLDSTPSLTWSPVPGATGYDVWINDQSSGTSQVVRDTSVASTTFTPATPLTPGDTYTFWVRAMDNSESASPWSAPMNFNIGDPAPTPQGPSGTIIGAVPTFSWSPITGADHYDLWVDDETTGQYQAVRLTDVTGTSVTPTALTAGQTYRWWVRAIDSNGVAGAWSSDPEFSYCALPAPTLVGPSGNSMDSKPTFTWNAVPGAVTYDLWVDDVTLGRPRVLRDQGVIGLSFTPNLPMAMDSYRFWVRAFDSNGNPGAWSAPMEFTISSQLQPILDSSLLQPIVDHPGPLANSYTFDTTLPTISWTAVPGADHYELWINNETTGQSAVVHDLNIDDTIITLGTALVDFNNYVVWVRAINAEGQVGLWSSPLAFSIDTAVTG